jgi:hypothetical protein
MPDLESLNKSLSVAAKILDTAASDIRDLQIEPREENIRKVGKALSLIFDIQNQLYAIDSTLKPEYLDSPSPFETEANKRFGEIILMASDMCNEGKYQEAISLYESYISEEPPDFYKELAIGQIHKIEMDYGV